jgi:hypothetical protein
MKRLTTRPRQLFEASEASSPCFSVGVLPRRFSRPSMAELTSDQRLVVVAVAERRRTAHSVAFGRRGSLVRIQSPRPLSSGSIPDALERAYAPHWGESPHRFGGRRSLSHCSLFDDSAISAREDVL